MPQKLSSKKSTRPELRGTRVKEIHITIRFPEAVVKKLRDAAELDQRSINSYVVRAIEQDADRFLARRPGQSA